MYIGRSVCVLLLLSLPLGMGRATVLFALLSFAFYVREPSESDTPHTLAYTHTQTHTLASAVTTTAICTKQATRKKTKHKVIKKSRTAL